MKGVIIAGFVVLLLGVGALYFGVIGKIIQKMFAKKESK